VEIVSEVGGTKIDEKRGAVKNQKEREAGVRGKRIGA